LDEAGRWLFYPVFVLARGIPLFWLLGVYGPDTQSIMGPFVIGTFLLLLAAERWIPYREDWRVRGDPQIRNDLGHSVAFLFVGARLGQVLFIGSVLALFGDSDTRLWQGIWPDAWPRWAQIILVVLACDLLEYGYHRATHSVPWLWHLHVLHHTPDRLHVLKTFRQPWTYSMLRSLVCFLPIVLVGAPVGLLLWFPVAASVVGALAHANVDCRMPAFFYRVLNTPNLHRIHHSIDPAHHGANYALILPLWDLLFGSFKAPERETVGALGLADDPVPSGFLKQLAVPFTLKR
jgi:sterol desaturase/sphingolipid hydroxylase (fatty acid hydroxylase superfamily)